VKTRVLGLVGDSTLAFGGGKALGVKNYLDSTVGGRMWTYSVAIKGGTLRDLVAALATAKQKAANDGLTIDAWVVVWCLNDAVDGKWEVRDPALGFPPETRELLKTLALWMNSVPHRMLLLGRTGHLWYGREPRVHPLTQVWG